MLAPLGANVANSQQLTPPITGFKLVLVQLTNPPVLVNVGALFKWRLKLDSCCRHTNKQLNEPGELERR